MLTRIMVIIGVFCAIWQAIIWTWHLPLYILPGPIAVVSSFIENAPLIWANLIPTAMEVTLGLILSIMLGIVFGLLMSFLPPLRYWLLPILVISQVTPIFALAPLLVLWFGYGMISKIITVVLMLFFPVASNFYDGLARTNQEWSDMAKTMHGKSFLTLWYIAFPAALPNLAAGIRIATVLAPMGAIVSEWVGASRGLGFLMLNANARLDVALVFASLITIVFFSLALYSLVNALLCKVIYW